MSEKLEEFNSQFPDSKYREIHAQYTGPMDTEEDKKKYQDSKAPINAKVLSFDEIKNTKNRVGWVIPKDYIVVDVDNKQNARVVFDILQSYKTKFSYMTGRKGGHFIFKNQRGIGSISAGTYCSLGFKIDIRANEKGYIILPENDTDRHWGNITNDVDDIPFFLVPLKKLNVLSEFLGMGEGDGRNDALLKHILAMIDYAKELTLQEKTESIRLINTHMFSEPLPDKELLKTVLRDDILNKENEEPSEEKGCMEEKLACRIVKDKQIITVNDDCYIYNGKYYRKMPESTELERIIHLEYKTNLKQKQRLEVIKFIKLKSWVPVSELNRNWNEIVFKNGVLNLAEMVLYPHSPSKYNTIYIDTNYIKDAPYSQVIDEFFNQISGKEADKKKLLYEMVGYCLIRKNVFEKFFICYGGGGTGKSTYLNLLQNLIGKKNAAYLSMSDLEQTYMPVELFGKLVNLGDDIPYKGLKETDILKKLVTGQEFAAQQKYKQPINFSNFAKLIYTTNKLPEVYDRTSGFYRRVCIIDIDNKIEKPDPFFLDRLTEHDYEYLLSVAIEHLINALKVNKLTECESSNARLEQYKTEQSSVLSFLTDHGYDRKALDHKPCMELYIQYDQYCRETGFKPLKKVNFDKEVCEELKMYKRNTTWNKEQEINQCWRFV